MAAMSQSTRRKLSLLQVVQELGKGALGRAGESARVPAVGRDRAGARLRDAAPSGPSCRCVLSFSFHMEDCG
jgi:hypothetical protein